MSFKLNSVPFSFVNQQGETVKGSSLVVDLLAEGEVPDGPVIILDERGKQVLKVLSEEKYAAEGATVTMICEEMGLTPDNHRKTIASACEYLVSVEYIENRGEIKQAAGRPAVMYKRTNLLQLEP